MQNKNFQRKKAKKPNIKELIEGVLSGDFISLSRAITLCESSKDEDREAAKQIIQECLPKTGNSVRIGITGVPGVGKSSFIESFGLHLIEKENKKVAVLAVDPSSERTKGSILGDKTRMEKLSIHPEAFIRPSPTSGSLGGVAHQSRESILLCEAAGFDIILIETVGVGQSETEVRQMTDFFLLLMLAGAGDELQGIKRGIMEMADGFLINKAEGDNKRAAQMAAREYKNALHLFPPSSSGWTPKVELCSAVNHENMDGAWDMIDSYITHCKKNGYFERQRKSQMRSWFLKSIDELLHRSLFNSASLKKLIQDLEQKVEDLEITPHQAAAEIFEAFKRSI